MAAVRSACLIAFVFIADGLSRNLTSFHSGSME